MSDLYINSINVPAVKRNKRIYPGGGTTNINSSSSGGGGGGGTVAAPAIIIPKLKLRAINYMPIPGVSAIRDTLQAKWDSANLEFLNHNPQLWIFRRNTRKKKIKDIEGSVIATIKKTGWKHEPHLNGVNFPNSNFYGGQGTIPVIEINNVGRHTEMEIPPSSGSWAEVMIFPWEYFWSFDLVKLSDITDFSIYPNNGDIISSIGRNSIPFRIAISIDNPNDGESNPKQFGDLSDEIIMHLRHCYQGVSSRWKIVYELKTATWVRRFDY